jgi:small-conductance mechanosensitive channel
MSNIVEQISQWFFNAWQSVEIWAASPQFYGQLAAIGLSVSLALLLAHILKARVLAFREPQDDGSFYQFRAFFYRLRSIVFPLLNITLLAIAIQIAEATLSQSWLIRIAQGLAVVFLLFIVATRFVRNHAARVLIMWVGVPIATLQVLGWLDNVTTFLEGMALTVGNINLSLLAVLRTAVFGALLFWLGRTSNTAGKQVIRNQQKLSPSTREVFAKLFEIALFVVIFLLLLQVMGINLTALAVFGGALGVGLGFGLQQIASNFISGIIILLDRSVTIGDHIELEDGRFGTLRELNMRYGVLETYDGKDVMVPNEMFITSSYTNWTHKDPRQRYALEFQVAYSTDLDLLFDNIRALCAEHPKVISGDDVPIELRPDAEIAGFGDSGIDILVEFWMDGVDDGKNRVGADLLHSIWRSIQEHGMQIPFPQREVRILGDNMSAIRRD